MFNIFRLPILLKHNVVGWFSFFRRLVCRHNIVERECVNCGKKGFGLPVFNNPPPPPKKEWSNNVTPAWFNEVRKYTIVDPDEYDIKFGIGVEIGVFTVEDYYYTKGWTLALERYLPICRDSQL